VIPVIGNPRVTVAVGWLVEPIPPLIATVGFDVYPLPLLVRVIDAM
jgi:hypothetical protein